MNTQLDIDANGATIRLHGRLTFAESGPFRRVVESLHQTEAAQASIDLAGVDFIDSAGLGLLLVARDACAARGGAVRLVNADAQVARMLRLARFSDFFCVDGDCAQV